MSEDKGSIQFKKPASNLQHMYQPITFDQLTSSQLQVMYEALLVMHEASQSVLSLMEESLAANPDDNILFEKYNKEKLLYVDTGTVLCRVIEAQAVQHERGLDN